MVAGGLIPGFSCTGGYDTDRFGSIEREPPFRSYQKKLFQAKLTSFGDRVYAGVSKHWTGPKKLGPIDRLKERVPHWRDTDKRIQIYFSVTIRTKDLKCGAREFLEEAKSQGFRFESHIWIIGECVRNNNYRVELSEFLPASKRDLEQKLADFVRRFNTFVAKVYEAKEAGQFEGSEHGKPPQIELVPAIENAPLVEAAAR